ncbi:MAG: glycosyltransferase family 4 protein [Thermoplasmata archaeon]|nr:glycosyltransferase family 4 protein [Thermoplasmata archaeon]
MEPLRLCVNTQTPLVQFLPTGSSAEFRSGGNAPVRLDRFVDGIDYRFSPGGVTRMVLPLVRRLLEEGDIGHADWVALNPTAPRTVQMEGMTLHHVTLPGAKMAEYAKAKEAIWGRVHGTDEADRHDDLFWSEAFAEYAYYNRVTTEVIQRLDAREDFDVFYIHDFQQLPVGQMLGTLKPKLFRWHIPFDESEIPEHWRAILVTYLNSYDVVVVSARRYARSLKRFGYRGKIVHLLPYVDPADYSRPSPAESDPVLARFGIAPDDPYGLVVARMDPTKAQDRAIDALLEISPQFPNLRLVLVGNGSFSGSRGGLGLSKSDRWRSHLEAQVARGGLGGRVVFTGHLSQSELDAVYERATFTVLPSQREGFGLVVVESWLHRKPVIVTSRAGIAELVRPGRNGLVFDPEEPGALAQAMASLAAADAGPLRTKLGRFGYQTAKKCFLDAAVAGERELLAQVVEV